MTTFAPTELTPRQREILAWVDAYIASHGFSPTCRDLAAAFGFKGPNGAACHLRPLRRKGVITWIDGKPRTLRVIKEADA